jgi:hypothetical protein
MTPVDEAARELAHISERLVQALTEKTADLYKDPKSRLVW